MEMKIAVVHSSQSGQLTEIAKKFCEPFAEDTIDWIYVEFENPYPFPWTVDTFFDAMPETVLEKHGRLKPLDFNHTSYDLIVFAYQPWFLSPSPMAMAVLQNEQFRSLANNTHVVTLIGSRNMWLNAHKVVKRELNNMGAKWLGNVPYVDKNNNLVSAYTILHWMLTGKKTKKWGFLPLPGVSNEDIQQASQHGLLLKECIESNKEKSFQTELAASKWIHIPVPILFIEGRAKKLFLIWANLITKKVEKGGNRSRWIKLFKLYLIFALFIVSPLVLLIYYIFVFPFSMKKIERDRLYYTNILD